MYKAVGRISILLYLYQTYESPVKYRHSFLTKEFLPALFKKKKMASPHLAHYLLARATAKPKASKELNLLTHK